MTMQGCKGPLNDCSQAGALACSNLTEEATMASPNDDANDHRHEHPAALLPHRLDESLLEPFHYISSVPGKDVRGKLLDCFQLWFQVPEPQAATAGEEEASTEGGAASRSSPSSSPSSVLNDIKEIVASLHNASLLIDDIEDNSKLRRGIPVAHAIFGVPTVINCANYVYFLAMEQCRNLHNPRAEAIFLGEILNLHRGQGQDIAWREGLRCPTELEYLQMVRDKTGGLFRLAVGLLQAFATQHCDTEFGPLVDNLAVYFQIRDDYINLADVEYFKSKSFCEDLTEGKFSFPMIHCIRSDPTDHRLLNILRQRTEDAEVKRYAQRILKEAGSLAYTRQKCTELKGAIAADIESFGGNPPLLKLIELLDVQLGKMDAEGMGGAYRGELHIDET